MYFYAQIDQNNNCLGISSLHDMSTDDHMIPISSFDNTLVGKIWNGTTFVVPPVPVDTRNVLTVSNITCTDANASITPNEIVCKMSSTVSASGTLTTYDGMLTNIDTKFKLPLVSSDGRIRIALANFVAGQCVLSITFAESGVWSITEKEINANLPDPYKLKFNDMVFYVTL